MSRSLESVEEIAEEDVGLWIMLTILSRGLLQSSSWDLINIFATVRAKSLEEML